MDYISLSASRFKRIRNYMLGEKKRSIVRSDSICSDWVCEYCGKGFVGGDVYVYFESSSHPVARYHYRCIGELYKDGISSYARAFLASGKTIARIGDKGVKCFLSLTPIHDGDMVYEHRWYMAKAEEVERINSETNPKKQGSYVNNIDMEWMETRREINENYKRHEGTNDPHPYSHVHNDLHVREEMLLDVIGNDRAYTLLKMFPELL
jgi:hypothetical protein